MRKEGYSHGDLHSRNVMCDKKLNWYIIDYGCMYHKKYIKNGYDEHDQFEYCDMCILMINVFIKNEFWDKCVDKQRLKTNKISKIMSIIKQSVEFKDIQMHMPFTRTNKTAKAYDICLVVITIVKYYELYMKALGYDITKPINYKYKKYITINNSDMFLLMIKHITDKNYDIMIKKLNKLFNN